MAPITVPVGKDGKRYLETVRCGQCGPCRVRRKRAWKGRMLLELEEHGGVGRFLTLTYRDDPGLLDYRDFQLFMKRYRRSYGKCRYFGVGEYGERSGRGHWHAIVFGHGRQALNHLDLPEWKHGFAYDGDANPNSIGYVASYVLKKFDQLAPSPRISCSLKPGIGFGRINAVASEAARIFAERDIPSWPGSFHVGGTRYPLSQGALVFFKRVYLEKGGQPPRVDDPDERHMLNMYYRMGDAFLEQREIAQLKRISERTYGSSFQRGSL